MGLVLLDLFPTDIALPSLLSINLELHFVIECPKIPERLSNFATPHVLMNSTFLLHSSSLNNFVAAVRVCSILYSRSQYFRCSTPKLICFMASCRVNRLSISFFASLRSSTEVSHFHLSCASPCSSRPQ